MVLVTKPKKSKRQQIRERLAAPGMAEADKFIPPADGIGLWPKAEKWLKARGIKNEYIADLWLVALENKRPVTAITFADWRERVIAINQSFVEAGFAHELDARRPWHFRVGIDGIAIGVAAEVSGGFSAHELTPNAPAFREAISDTGYHSFCGVDAFSPANVRKELTHCIKERQAMAAKKNKKRGSVKPTTTALARRSDLDAIDVASVEVVAPLDRSEKQELAKLEKIVERGAAMFLEVGKALREISERKLYRATHGTFEAYVEARFGTSRQDAYRQIAAARVAEVVTPIGDKLGIAFTSESQLRPLTRGELDKGDLEAIMRKVRGRTEGSDQAITAKIVAEEVHRYTTDPAQLKREAEEKREKEKRAAQQKALSQPSPAALHTPPATLSEPTTDHRPPNTLPVAPDLLAGGDMIGVSVEKVVARIEELVAIVVKRGHWLTGTQVRHLTGRFNYAIDMLDSQNLDPPEAPPVRNQRSAIPQDVLPLNAEGQMIYARTIEGVTVMFDDAEKVVAAPDPDCWQQEEWVGEALWNKLNAKRGYGWADNPWVWVVVFKKVEDSEALDDLVTESWQSERHAMSGGYTPF